MDKGSLELLLSQGLSVAEIAGRYGKAPSTVSCWMEKFGLEAVQRQTHPRSGGGERELLEPLVEARMTIAHHLDPRQKRYEISQDGVTISLDATRAEAKKCVLLCSNCHAEVEGGATRLPDTVS